MNDLIKQKLSLNYQLDVVSIELMRDFIGTLYHIKTLKGEYAFKLYQKDTEIDVEAVVDIMDYLSDYEINTPKIHQTINQELLIDIQGRKGILMAYIKGKEVNKLEHQHRILKTYKNLKLAMEDHQGIIPHHDFDFYVGRYLTFLTSIHYDKQRIEKLHDIGRMLFDQILKLEKGFTHGDFHNGNMIMSDDEKLYLLDFDACSNLSPYIDLVIIFDQTNFNQFNKEDVYKTIDKLRSINDLKEAPLQSLLAFIPIRHYELIATINNARETDDINHSFYDEQYLWITSFYVTYLKVFNKNSDPSEKIQKS